jgi:hypothetical protein
MAGNDTNQVRIAFTDEFKEILRRLDAANNYLAFELLYMTDPGAKYQNGLKISLVDISTRDDWSFDVKIGNKMQPMKIGRFVRYYFPGIISDRETNEFCRMYNKMLNDEPVLSEDEDDNSLIVVPEFVFNPTDVRATFLSLVTKTYPHGHEDEVLQFLPTLEKDEVGNYYKIIGENPQTMFTSHLDTADRDQKNTKLYSIIEHDEEYIVTDETTILGADDKAGVTILLYMMEHNVPGLYYFFMGEERGGIGSNKLSAIFDKVSYLKNIKRCVSFDRRDYQSVITSQLGRRCCSDQFGKALCSEYNKSGLSLSLDPTGIYTDSASFIDDIGECTNISVGYFHEHTGSEYQNITFLKSVCEASIKVDWNSLPTVRKTGLDQEIITKYKGLLNDIKSNVFEIDVNIVPGDNGGVYIKVDMDETNIESVSDSLNTISSLLTKYKIDPDVIVSDSFLKIQLR